uniref:Zinc finger protein n=1 Tax=Phallusia mammillata TaxID=59560 RepID=A0A6F9DTN2_9ASCI|nr:zinc finger protein [Phallusia mammillata]
MALLNALYKMQQMGQWCDVHLITASGQIIKSHACILSAASSTLEEMINLGSSDPITMIKTVLLPSGVDFKTMEILIQYIYTSNDIVRFRNQSKGKKIPTKDVTDKIINVGSLIGIELFETTSRVATENEKLKHNEENPTAVKEQKKRRSNAGNTRPRRNRRNTSNSEEHTFSSGEVPSPVHHADMDCAKVDEHTSPTFSCDECGKQFKQRKAWQLHMDEIHSPGKNICSFCQKSFATQQKLDRHIQRHRNRTTCTICNKSFTNDYVMQLHLRTHTGQERFSCHICEKKFPYKSSLTTHLLIHSGAILITCFLILCEMSKT